MPRVLNVGGGGSRDLPTIYRGWEQVLLDIDPAVNPDVVCDAKQMHTLPRAKYDSVYCSHTLEHFYRHEVPAVLSGFVHVLKPTGFAHIAVPDMNAVFQALVKGNQDIGDTFYHAGPNAISFHDVIYGWGKMLTAGNLFFAHKCGFTAKTLSKALRQARFTKALTAPDGFGNLHAFAFKTKPSKETLRRLGCL